MKKIKKTNGERGKKTYKSILGNINQLIVSTIDMGNLLKQINMNTGTCKENHKSKSHSEVISYITIMGRGDNIFQLLSSEDINSNEVTLSMTMLTSLGGGNFHNLPQLTKHHLAKFIYKNNQFQTQNIRIQFENE